MSATLKVLIYLVFVMAVYCNEHDIPVMLHAKRARYVTEWRFAAWAQRRAIRSYHSYMKEVEYVRG